MKFFKIPQLNLWSALVDLVVVILGILIAFNLNNWNQDRINKKGESIFLQELVKTLKIDLRDAKGNRTEHQRSIDAIDTILYAFDNDIHYNDSLISPFSCLLSSLFPVQSEAQFSELQSKGFDMISNDLIRENLISLYNKEYQILKSAEIELPQFQYFNLLYDYIQKNFFVSPHKELVKDGNKLPLEPLNYMQISTDPQFRLLIEQTQLWRKWIVRVGYNKAIKKQEELISDIESLLGIEPTVSISTE